MLLPFLAVPSPQILSWFFKAEEKGNTPEGTQNEK